MSVYRPLQTSFWQDAFVLDLTPEEKYFYLYLMTNGKTRQCGIYELHKRIAEIDTGYNRETIDKLINRFIEYGKIRYDDSSRELFMVNWLKFNKISNVNIEKCVLKELKEVKNSDYVIWTLNQIKELGYNTPLINRWFEGAYKGLPRGLQYPTKKETETETKTEEETETESKEEEIEHPVDNNNAYNFYQQNFGVLNGFIAEEIQHWINDLNEELVIEAMKRTLEQQKKWAYTKGILANWHNLNFKTIEDVHAADVQFKKRKQSSLKGPIRTEIVPDWLNQEQKEISPSNADVEQERLRLEEELNYFKEKKSKKNTSIHDMHELD